MTNTYTTENWKQIPGWEGYYEVSDQGRVRSLTRDVMLRNGRIRRYAGKVLSLTEERGGYQHVSLRRPGVKVMGRVHRLVLTAFKSPPPDPNCEACHIDGNPQNNTLSNLYWGTSSENKYDIVRLGHHASAAKTTCPYGHKLVAPNLRTTSLKQGRRACLACHKERGYAAYRAIPFSTQNADRIYREIMEADDVHATK